MDSVLSLVRGMNGDKEKSSSPKTDDASTAEGETADDGSLRPYASSLEYLGDQFASLAMQIQISREHLKREMREHINEEPAGFAWEGERHAKRANVHEFEAKLKMIRIRMERRLELSKKDLPRLEALCDKLKLDSFEKTVLVLIIGHTISPVIKKALKTEEADFLMPAVQVKLILQTFCPSFKDQVAKRIYFYKSSRLLQRGLVKLHAPRGGGVDLVEQFVLLDRRMLDWIVGLDTEINEVVEGSNLYVPRVSLEQVVLPDDQKSTILTAVSTFEKFRLYHKRNGLDDVMSYGRGLVILFCGPSGCGKTHTVNAIAAMLKKRVLLVNFALMTNKRFPDLQSLFREAEMSDAILFFDECESLFAQRTTGGSSELTELLTEMERHDGMIFLATNRPFDLDEAMQRRITSVFEFRAPNHIQRQQIWGIHTQHPGIPVAPGIDWEKISLKYELSGGFIKNAVMSALLLAIARDGPDKPVISEADVIAGCAMQMRGTLQMKSFAHRVVPKSGLDDLILSSTLRRQLDAVVDLEKARGVLFGQWGFGERREIPQSTTVLFWGPPGVGKSTAAEGLGFEIGRPLKVVNFSKLAMSPKGIAAGANGDSASGQTGLGSVFRDAQLMDAVLVLETYEPFLMDLDPQVLQELLYNMERFTGIVVLSITSSAELSSIIHRLDPDFARRFKFLLDFKLPRAEERARLWQAMLPAKTPVTDDIDFNELGRKYVFTPGRIAQVVYHAAAAAALRPCETRTVRMADLVDAAQREVTKASGDVSEICRTWFS